MKGIADPIPRRLQKIYIGWYNINYRVKPFKVDRHPDIIDTLSKLIRRLFLFLILFCEVERTNKVPVERSLFALDHRVVAINPH